MTIDPNEGKQLTQKCKKLYDSDPHVKKFFDSRGEVTLDEKGKPIKKRNPTSLSIRTFIHCIKCSKEDAIRVAKKLEGIGLGTFNPNFNPNEERFTFIAGLKIVDLARDILRFVGPESKNETQHVIPLPEAKEIIAKQHGISPDKVSILA